MKCCVLVEMRIIMDSLAMSSTTSTGTGEFSCISLNLSSIPQNSKHPQNEWKKGFVKFVIFTSSAYLALAFCPLKFHHLAWVQVRRKRTRCEAINERSWRIFKNTFKRLLSSKILPQFQWALSEIVNGRESVVESKNEEYFDLNFKSLLPLTNHLSSVELFSLGFMAC